MSHVSNSVQMFENNFKVALAYIAIAHGCLTNNGNGANTICELILQ
jgi:hypothetical protein